MTLPRIAATNHRAARWVSFASLLALSMASGGVMAQAQQNPQGQQFSTDAMEQRAQQGQDVQEGRLDPAQVAQESGEQQDDQQLAAADAGDERIEDTDRMSQAMQRNPATPEAQLNPSERQPVPGQALDQPTAPIPPAQTYAQGSQLDPAAEGQQQAATQAQQSQPQAGGTQGQQQAQGQQGVPHSQTNQAMANQTLLNATPDSLIGRTVIGADGQRIGQVKDVVKNTQADEVRIVVGSGGALGLGEKRFAVPLDKATLEQDQVKLTESMSKEQIRQQAQAYQPDQFQPMPRDKTIGFRQGSPTTG